jgi:apolipoprotein N-acyltransferase
VTFLIGWFAAVGNQLWQEGMGSRQARRTAWVFATALASVLLVGGARLAIAPPDAGTVRVASLSRRSLGIPPSAAALDRMTQNQATSADIEEIERSSAAVTDDLLLRSEREARAGAKLIFWGEGDAKVFKQQESTLLDRGRALARKYQVYLGMALGTWNSGAALPLENKIVMITPTGEVAWQYFKAHPVPGEEESISTLDDGRLRLLQTPFGRITSAICFDADFPDLISQAATLPADILLVPGGDWPAIDPLHTWMASFRAVEQGVNLVRQTTDGLSAAFDCRGRVLAASDYFHASDPLMISHVPIRGVTTIYSRIGDTFAWLCLATLPILALLSRRRQPRPAI